MRVHASFKLTLKQQLTYLLDHSCATLFLKELVYHIHLQLLVNFLMPLLISSGVRVTPSRTGTGTNGNQDIKWNTGEMLPINGAAAAALSDIAVASASGNFVDQPAELKESDGPNDEPARSFKPYFPMTGIKVELFRCLRLLLLANKDQYMNVYELCDKYIKNWTEADQCSLATYFKLRYSRSPHPILGITYAQAFEDDLNSPDLPTPPIYVCHTWNASVMHTLNAIEEDYDTSKIYWMDVFLINQHISFDSRAFESFPDLLQAAIATMSSMLVVMSNWDLYSRQTCFHRTWCLFEIYAACRSHGNIRFVLSPLEYNRYNHTLLENIDDIISDFNRIEIEGSSSIHISVRVLLLKHVKTGAAARPFEACNKILTNAVRKWFVDYAGSVVASVVNPDDVELLFYTGNRLRLLYTMSRIAYLLGEQRQLAAAELLYRRILRSYEALLGEDDSNTLGVVNNLSYLLVEQEKLVDAQEMAEKAADGYKRVYGEVIRYFAYNAYSSK